MATTSSTVNQPPKNSANDKGKVKVGEEPEANLNRGKEILMGEEPKANRDKGKAIAVEEPEASWDSVKPKTAAEEDGDDLPPPSKGGPGRHFEFIINPLNRGLQRKGYPCGFCDKRFTTPQALGGHQNGHKWERNLKQKAQITALTMGRKPYSYEVTSLTRPTSYRPFSGDRGVGLNPIGQHLQLYRTPYPKTGYGLQYAGLNRTFQHPATTSFNAGIRYGALKTGNNSTFPHSERASAGFGTGSGRLEIGKSAFQHPKQLWFSPGFKTQEVGNTSTFQHLPRASFSAGLGTSWSGTLKIGNDASQHRELAGFNPEFRTHNGRVDNMSGLHLHPQMNGARETQQDGRSGFDFVMLPTTNDQITGTPQQVRRSEIDFGLIPKRNGEGNRSQQGEASKIDLTLKL